MKSPLRFGVLGGDRRMRFLADLLAADGVPVIAAAMENDPPALARHVSVPALLAEADAVILPLPVTKDGKTLFAPLSGGEVPLSDGLAERLAGKRVFWGMPEKLPKTEAWAGVRAKDYFAREALTLGNAALTAEGAVALAIREHPAALFGAECLITGFGRIGTSLAPKLLAFGARVSGAARKREDRMRMATLGVRPLRFDEITQPYDIVFNTAPAPVLTAPILLRQKPDTLLIELASAPGGIDRKAAAALRLRVVDAPGLPGRVAPKTAAALIRDAVYELLEE